MFRHLFAAVSILFALAVSAAETDTKAVKAGLARMFPGTPLDSLEIRPSRVPGLLEAEIDTTVFYVTNDGKHVLLGDLIDTQERRNVTDIRRQALIAKIIAGIPESSMIVFDAKPARRTITVFTDVDCVYCRRLHNDDVPELNKQGVRVRYMPFPRQPQGSETYSRSVSVWCATDKLKALSEAKAGKPIAAKTCANQVEESLAIAQRLGVNGTPAIFLDDGRRMPGYVPAQKMLTILGLKGDTESSAAKK